MSVSVSPDGRWAAFGARQSEILLTELDKGAVWRGPLPQNSLGEHAPWFRATTFLPQGDSIALASDAGTIHLMGISDERFVTLSDRVRTDWHARQDRIGCLAASETDVVSASRDGTIVVWQPEAAPAWKRHLFEPVTDKVVPLDPDPTETGARFAGIYGGFGDKPPFLHLIDSATGHRTPLDDHRTSWQDIAVSADGRRMLVSSGTGDIAAWDTSGALPVQIFRRRIGDVGAITLGPCTRDGRLLLAHYWRPTRAGDRETELAVLDGVTGDSLAVRRFPLIMHDSAFAEDGSVVAATQEKVVSLLDPATLATRMQLQGHHEKVVCLRFSRDGRRLATAGNDREVIVWDTPTGQVIRRWQADASAIQALSFSADARLLLTSTADRPPRLWDTQTGRLLLEPGSVPRNPGMNHWGPASFTDDGQHIILGRHDAFMTIDGRPLGK